MSLYVFNNSQEIIKVIQNDRILSMCQEQEVNSKDEIYIEIPNKDWLTDEEAFYVAVRDSYERYTFHMYKILKVTTGTHTSEIMGIQVGYDELKAYGYIKDRRFNGSPVRTALEAIVEGTDWDIGYISEDLPVTSTNFYYITRLEALSKLIEVSGGEVQFRVEIAGNKIVAKRIDLYKELGEDKGKRFTYGGKLLSITKESDNTEVVTALVGRGKGEETETGGYGRRLTFKDVEWGTNKPVLKPLGQEYIEIPEMTELYGYPDGNPRYGLAEFEDIEDADELLEHTYRTLVDLSRPKIQFKASVNNVGDMQLGETVTIIRGDLGFRYKTRVFSVKRDLLDNNRTVVELGDKIVQSLGKTINKINNTIKDQREEVIQIVQTASNGKNKIFRGTEEPKSGMMVGDLWYKPLGNGETEMYQWNGKIWELIISSAVNGELEAKIEEAKKDVEDAREVADSVFKEIDDAVKGAGFSTLGDTLKNARDLALKAQEDAQAIIDNKDEVLGLGNINKAIADIENPSSQTWKNILESDSGYIAIYTKDNNDNVLNSASTQTAEQITTALSDYTSGDLDENVTKLLNSESSQTAGAITNKLSSYVSEDGLDGKVSETLKSESSLTAKALNTKLTSYVAVDGLDGLMEEVLSNTSSQTAGLIENTLTSYTTNEELGEVKTSINTVKNTALGNTQTISQVNNALGMGYEPGNDELVSLKFLEIESTVNGLQVTVGDTSKGLVSQYNQLAEGFRTTVEDVNGLNSVVGQLSDSWVLGIKNGEDLITAVNATKEGLYFKGDKILLDGDTKISGNFTVTDTIFAKNMSIDKFTTGTLNAANVNLINVNVDNIVGNISNFVKSAWNSISGNGVSITGDGLESTGINSSKLRLWQGGLDFYGAKTQEMVARLYTAYDSEDRTLLGASLGLLGDKRFSITKYNPLSNNYVSKFMVNGDGEVVSIGDFYTRGKAYIQNGLEVTGGMNVSGTVEVYKVAFDTNPDKNYIITNVGGGVNFGALGGNLNILSGGTSNYNSTGSTSITSGGNINLNGQGLLDLRTTGIVQVVGSQMRMHTDLNMNQNTIINQSDIRLKSNIKPAKVNALKEISRLEFIDFEWDKSVLPESPEGEQFGIKAQYAPFLQTKAKGEDSYLSIDLNKQVNLNSKAIQEIIKILQDKLGGI